MKAERKPNTRLLFEQAAEKQPELRKKGWKQLLSETQNQKTVSGCIPVNQERWAAVGRCG
jgi:hypothetical protein